LRPPLPQQPIKGEHEREELKKGKALEDHGANWKKDQGLGSGEAGGSGNQGLTRSMNIRV
jgi:hypothetical protein